jgi:polyisoprenoid-binding protein YceI
MARFTEDDAEVTVYTFKEGLLSVVAHDLKIRVGRFDVDVAADGARVSVVVQSGALEVMTAMKGGVEAPSILGRWEKGKIAKNITQDVLKSRRYPEIRFTSTRVVENETSFTVAGVLSLHGKEKAVEIRGTADETHYVGKIRLHQPDFGIKPFRAMMGTLRVAPHVEVSFTVPRQVTSDIGAP